MEKNGTPASPETARASSVLPVPGLPTSSTPCGMRAPSAANFSGNLRNSTISASSCLASSCPATSRNVTVGFWPVNMRALLRPKDIACELEPCAWRIMKIRIAPKMISGRKLKSSPKMLPNWLGPSTTTSTAPSAAPMGTPFSRRISSTVALSSMRELRGSCCVRRWTVRLVPRATMRSTSPCWAAWTTSVMEMSRALDEGRKNMTTTSTTATRMIR